MWIPIDRESNTYFGAVLNGVKTFILLDSGSCVNLIPYHLVCDLNIDECDAALQVTDDSPINVLSSVNIEFYVSGMLLNVRFIVTDTVDTTILGFEWVRCSKCCWMFGDCQFSIRGVLGPLQSRPSSLAHVHRIYVRECTAVPSDYLARVPIDLPACSTKTPSGKSQMLIEGVGAGGQ